MLRLLSARPADVATERVPPESRCMVCEQDRFELSFVKAGRAFWRCARCRMELQHPLPSRDALNDYYEAAYANGPYRTFTAAESMKVATARYRLRELTRRLPAGRWLDVGASNGIFVGEAIAAGIDTEGVELSDTAVRQARARGLPVRCQSWEDGFERGRFDTVTAFDLIEHVIDPPLLLEKMRGALTDGGHLVLTTPDLASVYRRLMGSRWYFYLPEEHLFYFSRDSIVGLLERAGFVDPSVQRIKKPLTYDYAITQFAEQNPAIHRVLTSVSSLLPQRVRTAVVPIYVGEMMVIARKGTA